MYDETYAYTATNSITNMLRTTAFFLKGGEDRGSGSGFVLGSVMLRNGFYLACVLGETP